MCPSPGPCLAGTGSAKCAPKTSVSHSGCAPFCCRRANVTDAPLPPAPPTAKQPADGEVAEWSKAHAWKVCRRGTVSRVRIPLSPPISVTEHDDGPFLGCFFSQFQRGLAKATALQRLPKRPKSVSEPHLSLIDRPLPSEGRLKIFYLLHILVNFLRAPCSQVHAIAKSNANPRGGRKGHIAFTLHGEDVAVVAQSVEERAGRWFITEDNGPVIEQRSAGDRNDHSFVTLAVFCSGHPRFPDQAPPMIVPPNFDRKRCIIREAGVDYLPCSRSPIQRLKLRVTLCCTKLSQRSLNASHKGFVVTTVILENAKIKSDAAAIRIDHQILATIAGMTNPRAVCHQVTSVSLPRPTARQRQPICRATGP